MRKYLILILVLIFTISMVYLGIGCQKGAPPAEEEEAAPAEEIILKIADFQGGVENILNAYNEFIEIFETKYPNVKIEYTQYTYTTYGEYLKPAISGGTGPDIFAVWPGEQLIDLVESGSMLPLSDYIDDEWKGWMKKAFMTPHYTYNDKQWATPNDAYTELIWVYKDMVEAIGKEVPPLGQAITVDELISWVEPAKEKGWDVLLAGHKDYYSITDAYFNMVHSLQKGDTPDMVQLAMEGTESWQQDIYRLPIEAFKKMHDAGVWRADAINMDYQVQAWGEWLEKKGIGIWFGGDWFAGSVPDEENNPDNPNIVIFQLPLVNEEATPAYNWSYGTNLGINSGTMYQDLALEFVRYTNSPEAAAIFVKNSVNPAAGLDVSQLEETDNPIFNECIKMFNFEGRYSGIYIYQYPEIEDAIFTGVINVMLGEDTADNVLANLDELSGYEE